MSVLAYGVVAWLFLVGIYGVVTSRNLIHMVVCVSVAQSATDVLLLEMVRAEEIGRRTSGLGFECGPFGHHGCVGGVLTGASLELRGGGRHL